jgi:hypothetical protein
MRTNTPHPNATLGHAQTSFLRPNLLLKVVPKVRELDEASAMPLFMVRV